jgi:diketogulonate reductase-like aldo/keto reductase
MKTLAVAYGLAHMPLPVFATTASRKRNVITKSIPASGAQLPAIGMGTWITFNVGPSEHLRRHRTRILEIFLEQGGTLIDSSPMYGSSADVLGYGLKRIEDATFQLFSASKIWTSSDETAAQMREQQQRWGLDRFSLVQVHNLRNWQNHLENLRAARERGEVGYIGVTTSHGSRHSELESVMRNEAPDFVQLTYNIEDRWAEDRLLPLARERGIAVIANRPFRRKALIRKYQDKPLPDWARDFDAKNWPQFLLKFIISHPAITCAIPATSQIPHIRENMGALYGRLPDAATRQRMIDYIAKR